MNFTNNNLNGYIMINIQEYMKYVFLILLNLTTQQYSFAQNPNPSTALDAEILNEMNTRHFPGVSTIIVKNGEVVWVESYGYADIANSIQVEDTTVFLLASVSKLFTGTAAMQLYEQGTVDIDANINQYLPWPVEIPNYPSPPITMRQLMTHTSSIDDNWGTMSSYYGYPDPTMSLATCMGRYFPIAGADYNATNNFLNSAPSTTYEYSNMATALNGYVVEASTGNAFDDYCDENIFDKLCMDNTAWHFSDFAPGQVAIPYSYQNGNYVANNHYGFADYPDGQLRSTILDIGNFMIAYLNGGTLGGNVLLTPTSVNEMLSLQVPTLNTDQGLNWYQVKLYHSGGEAILWGHNGGETGVSTNLYIDPQNNIGICVLTNGEGDGLYVCDELYDHALNMSVNNSIVPNCAQSMSINEFDSQKEEFGIYPNPAKEFIRVKMELTNDTQYSIYTISGKLVLSGIVNSHNKNINLSKLSSGLYVFQLENKPAQKIIIK